MDRPAGHDRAPRAGALGLRAAALGGAEYAEAADLGRELLEAHPTNGRLLYNVACCESLAGRPADAIEHIRQAVEMWDGVRGMAREDSDFAPLRDDPDFRALVGD